MTKLTLSAIILTATLAASGTCTGNTDQVNIWQIHSENGGAVEEIRGKRTPMKNPTPQRILDFVFKDIKEIHTQIILIKNEVAYINIEGDEELITNRSGTTGAWHYAATVVFNLTEFPDIKFVHFVDEGDHFNSGKVERIDFWPLMGLAEKKKHKAEVEYRLNLKDEYVIRYVDYLSDIGDEKSVFELESLRKKIGRVSFGPCTMTESEFSSHLHKTIDAIKMRKGGK